MPRFRTPDPHAPPGDISDLFAVGQVIDAAMQPGNFFVDPELKLTWIAARSETIPWEIFRGRLLPRTQTREEKSFLSWHVREENADEPTISVKLDVHARQIHVTRGFLAYVWEAKGDGVIDSHETVAWSREQVGSISLADFADLESLHDELTCLIWQAVVGTSRLPLTSVEAPLPHFSFGKLHYVFGSVAQDHPMHSLEELVACFDQPLLAQKEQVKLMEFNLRRGNRIMVLGFLGAYARPFSTTMLRAIFNDVSLSPYTNFVDNALFSIALIAQLEDHIDFCAHLLNQLHRHLTAFDLVTFHHRGANYPDALLLDVVLQRHLGLAFSDSFHGASVKARKRRRALRHGCLLRRHYEGHLVPDAPTSPGENARVLPASHPRVPEEQLTQSMRRRRRLFDDAPLAGMLTPQTREILALSVRDLEQVEERVEMGLVVFIDRPLGYDKQIGEPDLTPMLAHESFSPSVARRRWQELKKLCREFGIAVDEQKLDELFAKGEWPAGLPHVELAECPRPVAALTDVRKVADDFVIVRTLPGGLKALLDLYDWRPLLERCRLQFLADGGVRCCVRVLDETNGSVLALYDRQLRKSLELKVDASEGFARRAGVEWPRAGLRVVRVWEDGRDGELTPRQVDTVLRHAESPIRDL